MFDWVKKYLVPGGYVDSLETKTPVVKPAESVNSSMPWYITATLVVVGGVLLYKYGAKLLKIK